jgi:hypothetical protein
MSGPSKLWTWISDDRNRSVLAFLGAGLAAVAAAIWQLYLHFAPQPAGPAAAPATPIAAASKVDTRGVERLQASQKKALDAESDALDRISQQV